MGTFSYYLLDWVRFKSRGALRTRGELTVWSWSTATSRVGTLWSWSIPNANCKDLAMVSCVVGTFSSDALPRVLRACIRTPRVHIA